MEIKSTENDEYDKDERRRIEEEKNEANEKIEMLKAKKPVSDKVWDFGSKLVLGLVSMGGSIYMLSKILEFEENGSLRSKPGREFKIFNPMQWFR